MTSVKSSAVMWIGTAAGAAAVGVRALGRAAAAARGRTPENRQEPNRWLGVTVLRRPEEIAPEGRLPEPLRRLGDRIEVDVRPAPGDKGTELYARLCAPPEVGPAARLRGEDPRQEVRAALREAKALLETGEVVLPDAPPTTHPGPAGKLLQAVDRIAQGEGRL